MGAGLVICLQGQRYHAQIWVVLFCRVKTMEGMYTCMTCRVAFADADQQRAHYKTDWHRYNLKRKVATMPPVTAENFQKRVLAQRAQVRTIGCHHLQCHWLSHNLTLMSCIRCVQEVTLVVSQFDIDELHQVAVCAGSDTGCLTICT